MRNGTRLFFLAAALCFLVPALLASQGCSCGTQRHEIRVLDDAGLKAEELRKGRMINAFHAYLKEVDNNIIIRKIKRNVGSNVMSFATVEVTVLPPYEEAYIEGMKYYKVSKFEDATRCFKRALSYPGVAAFKTLEIKFLLMDSLRQSGKESEYMSQLNEYKQKYREIVGGAEPEFLLNQQKSSIIFTALEKSGEKLNANIETDKHGQQ